MIHKTKVFLLITLVVMLVSTQAGQSQSDLQITVKTSKPAYYIDEDIYVFGNVKALGTPVENATVALDIRDQAANLVTIRTLSTNVSGIYDLKFRLVPEASGGIYTANVSCTYGGATATNVTSFNVQKLSIFVLTMSTGRSSYKLEETVDVFGNASHGIVPAAGALVAVEVQDPSGTPIVVRALETDADGFYTLSFRLPEASPTGIHVAYASAAYENQSVSASTMFEVTKELKADINGDGAVNIIDITLVAMAWGTHPGDPRWDPRCDIDGNSLINIIDITLVAKEFGAR